jgi:hypothetical protein
MKSKYIITDPYSEWEISFSLAGVRPHVNPSKYNWDRRSSRCLIKDCKAVISKNRLSGLCDEHKNHVADLLLEVAQRGKVHIKKPPSHSEIIEQLIEWSNTRNYQLTPFFEELAFNVLGNVPEVTTLAIKSPLTTHVTTIESIVQSTIMKVVDKFFPTTNSSSYQILKTRVGDFPVRILAFIFSGLVLCEEANRGDRWFCRIILKEESKTSQLGGAMPLVYFAARQFNWGVEMKSVLGSILRK